MSGRCRPQPCVLHANSATGSEPQNIAPTPGAHADRARGAMIAAFQLPRSRGGVGFVCSDVLHHGQLRDRRGRLLEIEFTGPPADAQPVKDFLDPQLRAAKEKDLSARFDIRFDDSGLSLAGSRMQRSCWRVVSSAFATQSICSSTHPRRFGNTGHGGRFDRARFRWAERRACYGCVLRIASRSRAISRMDSRNGLSGSNPNA